MIEDLQDKLAHDLGLSLQPLTVKDAADRQIRLHKINPRVGKLLSCFWDFTNNNHKNWTGTLEGKLPYIQGLNVTDFRMGELLPPPENTFVMYSLHPFNSKLAMSLEIQSWKSYEPDSASGVDRFGIFRIHTTDCELGKGGFKVWNWVAVVDRVDKDNLDIGDIVIPPQPKIALSRRLNIKQTPEARELELRDIYAHEAFAHVKNEILGKHRTLLGGRIGD